MLSACFQVDLLAKEKQEFVEKLKEAEEAKREADEQNKLYNQQIAENQSFKLGLRFIEQELMKADQPWSDELASTTSPRYIREFGCMSAPEAIRLGIDVQTDHEYTNWLSYDRNYPGGQSILVENMVRDKAGKCAGFLKEDLIIWTNPIKLVCCLSFERNCPQRSHSPCAHNPIKRRRMGA